MDIKRIVLESNNEEETDYFVSSDGRIFKEITPSKNGNGYAMVTIYKNGIGYTKSVHRIVAKAFLQKVKGKEYINHINGDKMDNRLENLEWCTPHENTEHYHKTLRNGKPMYNQKACLQIIDGEVIAEYKSLNEASRRTGVSVSNIYCCCIGKRQRLVAINGNIKFDNLLNIA